MSEEPVGEAQSYLGGTFRHPKIRQTKFGGGWELNHLRDLQTFKTSAKLGLSSSIRGMAELCGSKDKVWRCDIRRDVPSNFAAENYSVRAGGMEPQGWVGLG